MNFNFKSSTANQAKCADAGHCCLTTRTGRTHAECGRLVCPLMMKRSTLTENSLTYRQLQRWPLLLFHLSVQWGLAEVVRTNIREVTSRLILRNGVEWGLKGGALVKNAFHFWVENSVQKHFLRTYPGGQKCGGDMSVKVYQ